MISTKGYYSGLRYSPYTSPFLSSKNVNGYSSCPKNDNELPNRLMNRQAFHFSMLSPAQVNETPINSYSHNKEGEISGRRLF